MITHIDDMGALVDEFTQEYQTGNLEACILSLKRKDHSIVERSVGGRTCELAGMANMLAHDILHHNDNGQAEGIRSTG